MTTKIAIKKVTTVRGQNRSDLSQHFKGRTSGSEVLPDFEGKTKELSGLPNTKVPN